MEPSVRFEQENTVISRCFVNVLFHCKILVKKGIDINPKLGKLRFLSPEVNSNIRY